MSKRVLYNITSASLQATNISGGTINATTFTGGNLSLSGDLKVAGTLTTVNITSTNLVNTNVSAGVVVASTLLSATGNSNTIGNIFTTSGNVGINTTSPANTLDVSGTIRASTSLTTGAVYSTNITSTNVVATNVSAATLNLSTGLTTASAQITNANVTTATVATLLNTNAISTNVSSGTLNLSTGLTSASAQITNENVTTSTIATARVTTSLLAIGNSNTVGAIITTGGNVGIGTTSPSRLLSLSGPHSNSVNGPHIWINTSDSPVNPVFQQLNWSADNVSLNFDMYYDGSFFKNSNSSTAWQIYKLGNQMKFTYQNGTAGSSNGQLNAMVLGSTGNIGIGTSAPAYTLDVNGTIRASTSLTTAYVSPNLLVNNATGNGSTVLALMTPNLTTGGNMAAMFFGQTSGNGNIGQLNFGYYGNNNTQNNMSLTFFGGGGAKMYLVNNGNIGIGTTSPSELLTVNGNIRLGPSSDSNADYSIKSSGQLTIAANDASTQDAAFTSLSLVSGVSTNQSAITVVGSSTLKYMSFATSNTERMRIDSSGNIGIGTTSPTALLHILESTANNTNPSGIFVDKNGERAALQVWNYNNNTNNLQLSSNMYWNSSGGAIVHNTSGGKAWNLSMGSNQDSLRVSRLTASDTSSTFFTINSAGNVGIGTTSPLAKLHISGQDGTISSAGRAYFRFNDGTTVNYNTGGWGPMSIYATGDIVSGSYFASHGGTVQTSDSRIKHNIQDINTNIALGMLRQFKPKTYKFKDNIKNEDKIIYGFVAQEIKTIVPDAIRMTKKEVPNIFELADVLDGNKIILTKNSTSILKVDDEIMLYDSKNNEIKVVITNIIDDYTFIIDKQLNSEQINSENIDNKIFVYGQIVDDFHYLNKDHLFTITTSALQEIDQQLQSTKDIISNQKTEINDLKSDINYLKQTINDLMLRNNLI